MRLADDQKPSSDNRAFSTHERLRLEFNGGKRMVGVGGGGELRGRSGDHPLEQGRSLAWSGRCLPGRILASRSRRPGPAQGALRVPGPERVPFSGLSDLTRYGRPFRSAAPACALTASPNVVDLMEVWFWRRSFGSAVLGLLTFRVSSKSRRSSFSPACWRMRPRRNAAAAADRTGICVGSRRRYGAAEPMRQQGGRVLSAIGGCCG